MPLSVEYLRPDLIASIQRLDLRAKFIVEGFLAGLHASPYHGFSVEFSEHRKYVLGDDLRLLDWGVFAKTDRLYVKTFQAETNLSAYILLDLSASMGFPSPGQIEPGGRERMTKLNYAISIAATLAYLMLRQQDAVGLFGFDRGVRLALPARSRRSHLIEMLSGLSGLRPGGPTDLAGALHEFARRIRKRSLVILLSDLLADPEPVIEGLHHLRFRGHDVIVFRVWDEAEATFPYREPTRFVGVEDDGTVAGDARALRSAYLEQVAAVTERYRAATAALRADFVPVHNTMNLDQVLVPFLVNRRRRY